MRGERVFQELVTITSSTAADFVVQSRSGWLDLLQTGSIDLHLILRKISAGPPAAVLRLQTAISEEGPWQSVASWTAETDTTIHIETGPGAPYQLMRFLRWMVEINAVDQVVCFGATVAPPECAQGIWAGSGQMPLPQRTAHGRGGEVLIQDWTTVELGTANAEVIQGPEAWIDTAGADTGAMAIQIPAVALAGATHLIHGELLHGHGAMLHRARAR